MLLVMIKDTACTDQEPALKPALVGAARCVMTWGSGSRRNLRRAN